MDETAIEVPRPLPRICECENGGTCVERADGGLECRCGEAGAGPQCASPAAVRAGAGTGAAVLVPVLLVLLLGVAAGAAWFVIRKRPL